MVNGNFWLAFSYIQGQFIMEGSLLIFQVLYRLTLTAAEILKNFGHRSGAKFEHTAARS